MIYFNVPPRPSARHFRTATAILSLLLPAALVRADAGDTLNFFAGTTVRHEDNLYRLPDNLSPQVIESLIGKPTLADRLNVTYFGVQADKSYSQQQFHLDASRSNYRYQTFERLNFEALDYSGYWKWHLTQRLGGNLSLDHKQTLANLADNRGTSGKNTITTENRRFDADLKLHGSWHLTGGVAEYRRLNSQAFVADDSVRQRSADAGLRYSAESGSSITLLSRKARGEYPDRRLNQTTLLDTGYTQAETELRMAWLLSGKSTLNGRLTHLERKHENFAQRDFRGTSGRLDYNLTPTGKLQLKLSAARDIGSWQETQNGSLVNYYVNNSVNLAPVWQIGTKTSLRLNLERSQRDYYGSPVAAAFAARQDKLRTAQLSFDWTPVRALTLSGSVQRDERSSNTAFFDYKANAASVSAQLTF